MELAIAYGAATDVGKQRESNEDSYVARAPLFAVADGMGGARAGEVASRLAVDTLVELCGECEGEPDDVVELLSAAAREGNRRIYEGAEHAFLNDTRPSYHAEAAGDAWQRTVAWFRDHLEV